MKKLTNLQKNCKRILICLMVLTYFSCEVEDDNNIVEETIIEGEETETPTEGPAQPAEEPTQPTEEPTQPTEQPSEPTEQPTQPIPQPTEEPTQPTEEPAKPIEKPTEEVIDRNLSDAEIILSLVNAARVENGLNTLTLNSTLNSAAILHSQDMQDNNYFSHTGLNGSNFADRIRALDYDGSPRGENIARGQRSAEAVHEAWINSEGHRNNILRSGITEMGIGRSQENNFWTQVFAVGR